MRQIILDTETTGLSPAEGHRIIEIGGLELQDRTLTGTRFHRYINPQREVEVAALEVHGISAESLADKPLFAEVADELIDFIQGGELVIHNAPFDVGFLDAEFAMLDGEYGPTSRYCGVLDTLVMARRLHPGQRNSLDALCRRYGVDGTRRTLHGALLDAELLAEVYLAMTGGQGSLALDTTPDHGPSTAIDTNAIGSRLPVIHAGPEELLEHQAILEQIRAESGACLWLDAGNSRRD